MPKTTTRKTVKPKKRGPKEERLLITDDPKAALDRFLKAPLLKAPPKKQR
jgi:hypothetical protein